MALIWAGRRTNLHRRLYYVPILVEGYWYRAVGGLLVAVASSMAAVPHIREQPLRFEASRYAEIVMFHSIVLTVGLLGRCRMFASRPCKIEQAILNVILNAIQATLPGSSVRVRSPTRDLASQSKT